MCLISCVSRLEIWMNIPSRPLGSVPNLAHFSLWWLIYLNLQKKFFFFLRINFVRFPVNKSSDKSIGFDTEVQMDGDTTDELMDEWMHGWMDACILWSAPFCELSGWWITFIQWSVACLLPVLLLILEIILFQLSIFKSFKQLFSLLLTH